MTPERSDQVIARVVAWHNRHPLAERIRADQVHSVGIVGLPFSVQGAVLRAAPALAPAPVAEAPAAAPAEAPEPAALPEEAAPDEAAADAETVVELVTDAPAPAPVPAAEPDEGSAAAGSPSILDRALVPEAASEPAETAVEPPPPEFRSADLPERPRRAWWADLQRRLRRQPEPWWALFSEDFIAPLTPRRVARWARRHGCAEPPLEGELPRRRIDVDPARRRPGDTGCDVELQLITAAIGVGERRVRLLLAPGPGGAVLGTRHWSRKRLAAGGGATVAGLALAIALTVTLRATVPGGAQAVAHSASAAASAAPAASAVAGPASAASAPPAVAAHDAASAPPVVAAHEAASAAGHAEAPAVEQAAASAPTPPASVRPRRGRVDVPPLVARLDGAERAALRQEGRVLRGESAQPADRAWALVTEPLSDRRQSERVAAQLQVVAQLQPIPMRTELLPVGRQWRAVFWPFPTPQDAEKVRLALADKGLKTEVMEF